VPGRTRVHLEHLRVPTGSIGPLGIIVRNDAKVLVTEVNGNVSLYAIDTPFSGPAQLASAAALQHSYGSANTLGLAVVYKPSTPKRYFMAQQSLGRVVEIDSTGGIITPTTTNGSLACATGLCGYPPNGSISANVGKLYVSSCLGSVYEIDPSGLPPWPPTQVTAQSADGIAITPSGRYMMTADSTGFHVIDLTLPYPSSPVYSVAVNSGDGITIGQGDCLDGKAYVNSNDGNIYEVTYDTNTSNATELEPPSGTQIPLSVASGGSRGDFIAVDPRMYCVGNVKRWPSMLITQSDRIVRLDPPNAGWFGPPDNVEGGIDANQYFCAGDGSLPTNCPCSNLGTGGHGCNNSQGTGGAILDVTGSTLPDSIVLKSSGELPSAFSVFIQGTTNLPNGVMYGDGLRCVGGSFKRIAKKNASGGSVSYPGEGDPTITVRSAQLGDAIAPGSSRYYQVMYRDPVMAFCGAPTSTFNISSGIRIDW
jgi:hypothetical protein